jgi:mono/diheme cytochrome c family protein
MMRAASIVVSVLLAAAIAVRAQAPTVDQPASAPDLVRLPLELPEGPATGVHLFAEKRCVQCHALGTGVSQVGPDLGRIRFPGTILDLAGNFWNHAPVMREKMRDLRVPVPVLETEQMANLLAFLTAYRFYLGEIGEPASPTRGREIFDANSCGVCHGEAEDFEKAGPSLEPYAIDFSAISIAQAMWNHGAEMADVMREEGIAWPNFSGTEMGDLLAYLQTGSTTPSRERTYYEPGSPRRGAELFTSKRCLDCHAIGGTGGEIGPDLGALGSELIGPIASIAGLMWNHSHGMTAEFRRRGIPRVEFSGQEMADVVAYLYYVNYAIVYGSPSRGEQVFATKCSGCHVLGSGNTGGSEDLAAVPNLDDPTAIITAMWNHAAEMENELQRQGMIWPRFADGEVADLSAFLLVERGGLPSPPPRSGTATTVR